MLGPDVKVTLALPSGCENEPAFNGYDKFVFDPEEQFDRRYWSVRSRLDRAHLVVSSTRVAAYNFAYAVNQARTLRQRLALAGKYARSKWNSTPSRYRALVHREFDLWQRQSPSRIGDALAEQGFDCVFFPAPHSERERALARHAKLRGLRTSALVLSFDNLTTKGRHPIVFDEYVVWSERMKRELLKLYPEIPPASVQVTGTPQFHFYYREEYRGSRAELAAQFGLDAARPIVLYAAGPDALLPHEAPIVQRFCEDLETFPEAGRPQLIVRLHPIERSPARWEPIKQRYPHVRWDVPWQTASGNAEWAVPSAAEIKSLCMIVRFSDVVINAGSTMSLDASICDTPVVCVDYALAPFEKFAKLMHNFYDYDHYRPIATSGAIRIARTPEELVTHLRSYLADPTLDRPARSALVREICGDNLEASTEAIAAVLSHENRHVNV